MTIDWDEEFKQEKVAFKAIKSFTSPELRSAYEAGLSYTWRNHPNHNKLRGLLPEWHQAGLVKLARELPDEDVVRAKVLGKGEVQTIKASDVGTVEALNLIGTVGGKK